MPKFLDKEEYKQKLRKFFDGNLDASGQFDLIEEVLSEHEKLLTAYESVCDYDEKNDNYVNKQTDEMLKYKSELETTNAENQRLSGELDNVKKKYEERFFGRELCDVNDPRLNSSSNISLFTETEI
ncbi:hypothetical protein [Caloranaerobacter azorensis]|uniref:hypothetical protein n=1 Tax=Caloranaerobacter azorensis TaxID=116090 RepID=UPI0023EFDB25|nr:hypothetical protein [Caloranaerobacter azorensis]